MGRRGDRTRRVDGRSLCATCSGKRDRPTTFARSSFSGADRGTEPDHPQTMAFARSLPLDTAMGEDILLATSMNGEPLTPSHGYPLRLIVPGWYGVASVKWLTGNHPHRQGVPRLLPERQVHHPTPYGAAVMPHRGRRRDAAQVGDPAALERPEAWHRHVAHPWHGVGGARRGCRGRSERRRWAELVRGRAGRHDRALFLDDVGVLLETHSVPGAVALLSRAVSTSGRMQPMRHDPLCSGYLIHYSRPIEVDLEFAWSAEEGGSPQAEAIRALEQAAEDRSACASMSI